MISTLGERLPNPQANFLDSQSSFLVVGQNNINGALAPPTEPFVIMSANKVPTSECDIDDNGADYFIKIPYFGHLIQRVIT